MTDAGEPSEGVIFEAVTSLEGKVLGEILEGIKPEVKQKHNSPDILDEKVDATTSFEIFAGKRYWGTKADEDNFKNELNNRLGKNSERPASQVSGGLQRIESPMERYQRLRVEVSEFENDLRALEAATMSEKEKEIKLMDGFLPKVKNGISDLLKQLSNLEGNPSLGPLLLSRHGSSSMNAFQSDLSTNIKTNFEQMKFNSDATGMAESSGTSSRSMTDTSRLLVDAALEERINRLEKYLGVPSTNVANSSSVLSIMDDLEKKMATLTPAFLESVRRRTKMLIQELDSVSKKMKRHGGSLSGQTDQEKEKIIKLYDAMVKYDHVSEEIPVIVERLKSVEGLHRQSLDFDRKLKQLEEAQLSCLEYLKRDEEILTNLEQSMTENAVIMEKNINVLDEKFKGLQ